MSKQLVAATTPVIESGEREIKNKMQMTQDEGSVELAEDSISKL